MRSTNTGALIKPHSSPLSDNLDWQLDPNGMIAPYCGLDILAAAVEQPISHVDTNIQVKGDQAVRVALGALASFREAHSGIEDKKIRLAHNESRI